MTNLPVIPEVKPVVCVQSDSGSLIPADFDSAYRFSRLIAQSGLAPAALSTPEKVFVAIQMGMELGLKPMQAVQNIAVVNGRPTLWGDAALGVCQATGKLSDIVETIAGEGDAMTATCKVTRSDRETPVERTFSVADARKASLWAKRGPWQDYPKRMLQMRARGFALRDAFPDALKGVYVTEELQGVVIDSTAEDLTARVFDE